MREMARNGTLSKRNPGYHRSYCRLATFYYEEYLVISFQSFCNENLRRLSSKGVLEGRRSQGEIPCAWLERD